MASYYQDLNDYRLKEGSELYAYNHLEIYDDLLQKGIMTKEQYNANVNGLKKDYEKDKIHQYFNVDKDGNILLPSKEWLEKFVQSHKGNLDAVAKTYKEIINDFKSKGYPAKQFSELATIVSAYVSAESATANHFINLLQTEEDKSKWLKEVSGLTQEQMTDIVWYTQGSKKITPPPPVDPPKESDDVDMLDPDTWAEWGKEFWAGITHPVGVIDSIITGTEEEYANQINDPNAKSDPLGIGKALKDIGDNTGHGIGLLEDWLKDLTGIDPTFILYVGLAVGGLFVFNQASGIIKNVRSLYGSF